MNIEIQTKLTALFANFIYENVTYYNWGGKGLKKWIKYI